MHAESCVANTAQQCDETDVVQHGRGEMAHARTHRVRATEWRARGACVNSAFRHAEAAKRAFDRVVAQRFETRCATL
eukprot:2172387-Lingulodinium_polyedra.AAC.1